MKPPFFKTVNIPKNNRILHIFEFPFIKPLFLFTKQKNKPVAPDFKSQNTALSTQMMIW